MTIIKFKTKTTADFTIGPTKVFSLAISVKRYYVAIPNIKSTKQTKTERSLRIFVLKYGFSRLTQIISDGSSAGLTVKL